jgi:hypothetical protein
MAKQSINYILSYYANPKNQRIVRSETEVLTQIQYTDGVLITLIETNSLIKDNFSLTLHSAEYIVESKENQITESMLHNHDGRHSDWHLQFNLQTNAKKTIRIIIDSLSEEEHKTCICGFLYLVKNLLQKEEKKKKIDCNLKKYFFNEHIDELEKECMFLLGKIKIASNINKFMDENDAPLTQEEIDELKKETHLLPFLQWN